jgi:predicted amidohydrolase
MSLHRRNFLSSGLAAAGAAATPALAQENGIRYSAIALQLECDAVNQDKEPQAARARMMASIERIGRQVGASAGFVRTFNGTDVRLVVLPEYFLTGFPLGETRQEWKAKASIDIDGAEYKALGAIAKARNLFLAGNAYENDPAFPDLYFQANFVIAPTGAVILRYRRLISLFTPTPYDVWDRYLQVYGEAAIFPVADTEIGKLATIASEEILYPEIARMHALKGAEVLIHPTSEVGAPDLTQKDIAKRARAIETMAYVVSANSAGVVGYPIPEASTDAMSKVVDYGGKVMAVAGEGESMVANAVIDLPALRAYRRRTGMSNFLARQPNQLYARFYANSTLAPANKMANGQMMEQREVIARQRAVIERMVADGVIK